MPEDLDPTQHLIDLRHVTHEIAVLIEKRFDLVDLARRDGATWADIGEALGITRQAAQQYYGT